MGHTNTEYQQKIDYWDKLIHGTAVYYFGLPAGWKGIKTYLEELYTTTLADRERLWEEQMRWNQKWGITRSLLTLMGDSPDMKAKTDVRSLFLNYIEMLKAVGFYDPRLSTNAMAHGGYSGDKSPYLAPGAHTHVLVGLIPEYNEYNRRVFAQWYIDRRAQTGPFIPIPKNERLHTPAK